MRRLTVSPALLWATLAYYYTMSPVQTHGDSASVFALCQTLVCMAPQCLIDYCTPLLQIASRSHLKSPHGHTALPMFQRLTIELFYCWPNGLDFAAWWSSRSWPAISYLWYGLETPFSAFSRPLMALWWSKSTIETLTFFCHIKQFSSVLFHDTVLVIWCFSLLETY